MMAAALAGLAVLGFALAGLFAGLLALERRRSEYLRRWVLDHRAAIEAAAVLPVDPADLRNGQRIVAALIEQVRRANSLPHR